MATTTRKKKTKILENFKAEVIVEKPTKEESVEEKPTFPDVLAANHLLQLETLIREVEIRRLNLAVEEQDLKNLLLSLEVLQNKIEKQRIKVQGATNKYDGAKQSYIGFKAELWPKYGFSADAPMAYNPLSGIIDRNTTK